MKRLLLILFLLFSVSFASVGFAQQPGGAKIGKFYPNPATSYINFEVSQFKKGLTLHIYNFMGKKVFEQQNINDKVTLNLSDYARGVYIFQLLDGNGKIIDTNKFQVVK